LPLGCTNSGFAALARALHDRKGLRGCDAEFALSINSLPIFMNRKHEDSIGCHALLPSFGRAAS
jgi:hypothetical protein